MDVGRSGAALSDFSVALSAATGTDAEPDFASFTAGTAVGGASTLDALGALGEGISGAKDGGATGCAATVGAGTAVDAIPVELAALDAIAFDATVFDAGPVDAAADVAAGVDDDFAVLTARE